MEEEKEALQHGINKIWDDIKDRKKEEYASIPDSWSLADHQRLKSNIDFQLEIIEIKSYFYTQIQKK
jgi:hypothetical protein